MSISFFGNGGKLFFSIQMPTNMKHQSWTSVDRCFKPDRPNSAKDVSDDKVLPLNSYRDPIGKDRLPFPPIFRGELLIFRGVIFIVIEKQSTLWHIFHGQAGSIFHCHVYRRVVAVA